MISVIAKAFGVLLMGLAFAQWITFDYPDVNPFWPGAVFAPGMFSQFVNWMVVCVIGASGWGLFQYGKSRSDNSDNIEGSE